MKIMKNHSLIAVALFCVVLTPAWGAGDKPAASSLASRLVTVDYANADVSDVIRALSTQSGVNVALNPGVKGQVTVHLRDKTIDEAMVVVANMAGLGAKKVNGTYVIAPRAEMRQTLERLGETRRVEVKYLSPQAASDLAQNTFNDLTARPQGKAVALIGASEDIDGASKLIAQNDMLSPEDVHATEKIVVKNRVPTQCATTLAKITPGITAEAAGDSVVISGTQAQVETAKKNLALLDVPGQPDVEMRVYNIRYASPPQLVSVVEKAVPDVTIYAGPDSNAPTRPYFAPISGQFVGMGSLSTTSNSSSTNTQTQAGEGANANNTVTTLTPVTKGALSLLLKGSPAALDQAFKVLDLMDVSPKQMRIEAKIVETSPEFTDNIGVNWSWTRFGAYEAPAGTAVSTADSGGMGGDFTNFTTRNLGLGAFSRVPFSFQAIVNAMVTKKEAKILANPSISVINDQDASIFIGDTLRFNSLAQSSATAGSTYTVVEVPVGIILLVHPRINDDGNATLRVHPVVSTVTATSNGLPQTSAREVETTVRVKDGDTLVIGGLIRDEDTKTMSKIPLLGDLPIIGALFRNTSRDHRKTEIMIVMTIHLDR